MSHYGPERNLARAIVLVVVLHVLHIEMLNRVSCKGFFSIYLQTGVDWYRADESMLPYMIYKGLQRIVKDEHFEHFQGVCVTLTT